MSKTVHHGERRHGHRRIRVRGERRETPDYRKLARAFIALARAQAEAEAEAAAQAVTNKPPKSPESTPSPATGKAGKQDGDAA